MALRFRILNDEPGYQPLDKLFPSAGFREAERSGLIVRIFPKTDQEWDHEFSGFGGAFSGVFEHPDGLHLIVVAKGIGYRVDPETKEIEKLDIPIVTSALLVPQITAIVLASHWEVHAVGPDGVLWRSAQVAYDGIRNIHVEADSVIGEGESLESKWVPFVIDLKTGKTTTEMEFPRRQWWTMFSMRHSRTGKVLWWLAILLGVIIAGSVLRRLF